MDRTMNKIIQVARSQIGYKEIPRGSNRTKYGKWYGINGVAWCAIFVSWCFDEAGFPLPTVQDKAPSGGAYCPFFEDYARKNGQWFTSPKVGDLVLFHFGRGIAKHIGIVSQVLGNGKIKSIEGNTSNSSNDNGGIVMERVRSSNLIRGYFRPQVSTFNLQKPEEAYYRLIKITNPFMYGNDVKAWQKQMNWFKEYQGLDIDGYYGQESLKVCLNFQEKRGLDVDGIIGPQTWRESFKKLT